MLTNQQFMIRSVILVGVLAAALFQTSCSKPEAESGIAVRVGSETISREELLAELNDRLERGRPVGEVMDLAREMAVRRQLVQRALELHLDEDPELVHQYENMLIATLRERELAPEWVELEVSEDELRALYQERIEEFTKPAKVRLALLHLSIPEKADSDRIAEIRARMEDAREQALEQPSETRGFGSLAIDYSEDQATRYRGGDVGWFDEDRTDYRFPEAVLKAGFRLPEVGGISEVVETAEGYFLVKKIDARSSQVRPFEEVEAGLRRQLLLEKQHAEEQAFFARLDESIPVQYFPEHIAHVGDLVESGTPAGDDVPPSFPN